MDKHKALILCIRTDRPEAELYLYGDKSKLAEIRWLAHRQLAETIHLKIQEILNKSSISWEGIGGIVVFAGPGSFTGLRIGISTANALAYANKIPIVAKRGDKWMERGIKELLVGKNDKIATPFYGQLPRTTTPKK